MLSSVVSIRINYKAINIANEALTPESFRLVSRQLAEHLSAFLEKGSGTESFGTEVDQPCRDGSIVHTEVTTTTMFNQQGQVEIIGVSRNITERRRTERALRENEERLRLSLQAANQGLYDLNVQSGAAIVNREYAEMLGYDPGTFVETNARWIERLHPGDQAIVAKAYQDYINGLRPEYRIEFRQRTRDRHSEVQILPFGDLGGDFEIYLDSLHLQQDMMPQVEARIFWQHAKLTLDQSIDMGQLDINVLTNDANQTQITLANNGGDPAIRGDVNIGTDRSYVFNVTMKPKDATGNVAQSLNLFAQRQADGSYRFKQNGNLRQLGF